MTPKINGRYNWKRQSERLIYTGKKGVWHQFSRVDDPHTVWCEVLDEDLHMLEETKFVREPRYVVFKISDIQAALTPSQVHQLNDIGYTLAAYRDSIGKSPFNAVVVEADWPEFEPTWAAIEARMMGSGPTLWQRPLAWEVWVEGYSCTGNQSPARLLGRIQAATFGEACDKLCSPADWQRLNGNYDPKKRTVYGCRLFDNEQAARASFG